MRVCLLILILAVAAYSQMTAIEPGVSQELAKWRSVQYSNISYKLNLTLEKMSPVLRGTIEISLKAKDPGSGGVGETAASGSVPGSIATGSSSPIILDWRKIVGHEKDSTIENVSINGKLAVLSSSFSRPLRTGEPVEAETQYQYYEGNDHLIFRDGVLAGVNVIKLDFTSPILTSGSAITRYIDKEDGSEYIYSLFVPSDASTAFPCFDQPDLKARFTLTIQVPSGPQIKDEWQVVSNANVRERSGGISEDFDPLTGPINVKLDKGFAFEETKLISTYVFAFAAGPFEEFTDAGDPGGNASVDDRAPATPSPTPTAEQRAVRKAELKEIYKKWLQPDVTGPFESTKEPPASHIYVRKSQARKFKPHAAEVFRLTSEGTKYLEQYFDYKFPFPKYDLVLIPEFPFGGMEHAGATFLREDRIIFPQEPTKNDYITRANVIFHETAHQWFGDTVTMKWFDDLWLKEGFAEFMAYKTMEKVMPEYNAWKVFYERNKQAAYLTDSTKGTTPIYQPIANLSAAKSAYGNIVYRKAPSFLRQAEFYLGEDKFQTAVRAFLKKHQFANATWQDLVSEFETARNVNLERWAEHWIKQSGLPIFRSGQTRTSGTVTIEIRAEDPLKAGRVWVENTMGLMRDVDKPGLEFDEGISFKSSDTAMFGWIKELTPVDTEVNDYFVFPNYQDYGYGIFLLDDKSRDYILKNIQNEKDDFLRSMMWGSLWDSVREAELDPKEYVELVIKVLSSNAVRSSNFSLPTASKKIGKPGTLNVGETDETTIATLLSHVSTAMNYYLSEPPAVARGLTGVSSSLPTSKTRLHPSATAGGSDLRSRFEELLLDKLQHAPTPGQRVTYYRAYVNMASTSKARSVLKQMLEQAQAPAGKMPVFQARTKDKFEIVTRLIILGDAEAAKLLAELERKETSDDAKRYAYAARAAFASAENKAKYWNDFVNNKSLSESWIESAILSFNSLQQSDLSLPYLDRALAELPNLKRTRKIFFINNWLSAIVSGQRSEQALAVVTNFLASNPNLDNDLRLKILENVDVIERAVRIRAKYEK
jgi:aminopeptidase N